MSIYNHIDEVVDDSLDQYSNDWMTDEEYSAMVEEEAILERRAMEHYLAANDTSTEIDDLPF